MTLNNPNEIKSSITTYIIYDISKENQDKIFEYIKNKSHVKHFIQQSSYYHDDMIMNVDVNGIKSCYIQKLKNKKKISDNIICASIHKTFISQIKFPSIKEYKKQLIIDKFKIVLKENTIKLLNINEN